MSKKKSSAPVPVHNIGTSVKVQLVEPVSPPAIITLPGEIAEAARLEDDYELTVVVGRENIKRFLDGAPTDDGHGGEAVYEGGDKTNAILLTF